MNDREIFAAAIKLKGDQRIAFLDAACGLNASLRQQVDGLLLAHEDSKGPLPLINDREIEATQAQDAQAEAGTLIGPYKLLEEIGEGGMGSVWVAEQSKPIRRKVAIKLIKLGMDSKAVLARFEAERQALAMMDHPNIARVLDGGMTDQGRPYFAMEYVKGVPLIEYSDNAKLSIRERLELFVPICKAVQHAHQKGVIHRDLKPSNILVCLYDGKPVPKVIDFGLAKAIHQSLTEKTLHTAHGMMVGTPLYMSPEQAESNNLDVDTRTDIYSLGVILYELLTGSTPLEKAQLKDAAVNEILRLIKEVEPPKPSTRVSASQPNVAAQRRIETGQLARSVSGDLDWVVMKALEKERSRRYETANGLAEDIRRHLSDEPVSAGPPSAGYRVRKFIKRNRASVAAGCFVAAALVVAVLGTSAGMVWALNERKEAERQRARAEQREEEAIDAVRRFGDAVANNAELKNRPELAPLRKTLLQEPLAYFKSFGDQLQKDADTRPGSLHQLAGAAYNLAILNDEIGNKQDALAANRQALAIWERLARDHPTVDAYQDNLARSYINTGNRLRDTGQRKKAMAAHRQALEIFERLVRDNSDVAEYQCDLAKGYHNIALLLGDTGQLAEALASYQQALEIRQRLVEDHPTVAEYQHDLAKGLNNIGGLLSGTGQPEDGLAAEQQALAIRQRLVRDQPDVTKYQSNLAISYDAVASMLRNMGQPEEALATYLQALVIRQRLAREHPSVTAYQSRLAHSHHNIGHLLYREIGKPEEALASFRDALEIRERLVQNHPTVTEFQDDLAHSQHNIGHLLGGTGQPEEALAAFRQALEIRQRLAQLHPKVVGYQGKLAGGHNDIGILLVKIGQPEEALAAYEQALEIRERLAREYPKVAKYQGFLGGNLSNIAMLDLNAERFSDACTKLIRAIKYQKRALDLSPNHTVFRQFLESHYGLFFSAAKELGDAQRWSEVAVFGRQLIDQKPDDSLVWLRVAPLLVLDGDQAVYAEFCKRMVKRFANKAEVTISEKVCKACLLKPESINLVELPSGVFTSKLDDGTAEDWFLPWGWGTRALLAYRSGNAESALGYANKSEECEPAEMAHALNLAVVAMAQHQLGDREAAERALDELSQIVDRQNYRVDDYHDLLIVQILLTEAEAKINES